LSESISDLIDFTPASAEDVPQIKDQHESEKFDDGEEKEIEEFEDKDEDKVTSNNVQFVMDTISKQAPYDKIQIKQIFYGICSSQTSTKIHHNINSKNSGEGKSYLLQIVSDIFPDSITLKFNNMTDKALYHQNGVEAVKDEKTGEYSIAETALIGYLESFANTDPKDRANHLGANCPNEECKNGFLDFEYIGEKKIIKDIPGEIITKNNSITFRTVDDQIHVGKTIFERFKNGDFTERSKVFQAILIFMLENQYKFYKKREIQNKVIEQRKELFENESTSKDESSSKSRKAENYNKSFERCLQILRLFGLVVVNQTPSEKNKNLMVDGYRTSKQGKNFALAAKYHMDDLDDKTATDLIYDTWKVGFEDESFSLDLFCKSYFKSCLDLSLFKDLIKLFVDYITEQTDFLSYTELFTRLIFYRYKNNESNNKRLWEFWKSALINTNEKRNYFFNHIKLGIERSVEIKVHDFNRYEDARYENRSRFKFVTIEAVCQKCNNEYIYLQVPIIYYLKDFFYRKPGALLEYTKSLQCKRCNNKDFKFLLIK